MVYVPSWYAGSYPRLTDFVAKELPKAADNATTFNAFIRYAEYTYWGGSTVFWPTAKPSVEIENLNKDATSPYYILAKYKTAFTGKIFVDEEWAKRFEKDYQLAHAKLLMEACILHEMCHRGDWDDGVEQTNEPGEAFEIAAYGALQKRYW
jgi:hypothetical protein